MVRSFVSTILKLWSFTFLTSLLLFSCSNNDEKKNLRNYYRNDLESYNGWIGINGFENLVTEDAHSGSHAEKTDSLNNYSITFERKLQDLSHAPIKLFNISVWLKCPDQSAKGSYVLSFENGSEIIKYFSFDINKKEIKPNDWIHIEGVANMPDVQPKDSKVKIYFWNKGTTPILVDDFEFSFEN